MSGHNGLQIRTSFWSLFNRLRKWTQSDISYVVHVWVGEGLKWRNSELLTGFLQFYFFISVPGKKSCNVNKNTYRNASPSKIKLTTIIMVHFFLVSFYGYMGSLPYIILCIICISKWGNFFFIPHSHIIQ